MTTFFQGDCVEVMKDMSDASIDCFICDLPYGCLHPERKRDTTKWYDSAGQARGSCPWDVKIDLEKFWEQVKRLAKNDHTPVLMFCNTKFGIDLINSNPDWFRYDLVWDKQRGVSFLSANKMPMKSHEMIYVFSKKGAFYRRVDVKGDFKATLRTGGGKGSNVYNMATDKNKGIVHTEPSNERCPLSVITLNNSAKKGQHPTEKPEELYEWLLRRYVPEGGTVLDPTAGSFNSCFVADRLGYVALGIEKDEGFYAKAVARLNP
jgi:site-specific DNA-methyltransferase (adenine-specific)